MEEAVAGPLVAAVGGGFVAAEEVQGTAGLDFEAELGGFSFGGVEVVEGCVAKIFEAGDLALGELGGGFVGCAGVGVAEFRGCAEEVEGECGEGFGPGGFGSEGLPAVDEGFAALFGAADLSGEGGGFAGESVEEVFGVEAAVVVPGEEGASGDFGTDGGVEGAAVVDLEGAGDELGEEPFLFVVGGVVVRAPGFDALGEGFGFFVGEDDAGAGEAVLEGVATGAGLAVVGGGSGAVLGVFLVGGDLAEGGHEERAPGLRVGWGRSEGYYRGGRGNRPVKIFGRAISWR